MKICGLCQRKKVNDNFYKVKSSKDGLHQYCKQCCKVMRALESVRKRDKKAKITVRQLQRAKKKGIKYDANITLAGVYKRDLGICKLCGLWVQPRYASMDHVKPISWGGTHTWGNIQLTHLKCNLRKGDRFEG